MSAVEPVTVSEAEALAAVARLLGRLLVREVDRDFLRTLRTGVVASALADIGIDIPTGNAASVVDGLASAYYSAFLDPQRGVALVQSLAVEGRYEGDSAVALRQLAAEAGLEHDSAAARGAPGDHLGSILLLWADLAVRWPAGARALEDRHLAWARRPLETAGGSHAFYGAVARATRAFVEPLAFRASWGVAGGRGGS